MLIQCGIEMLTHLCYDTEHIFSVYEENLFNVSHHFPFPALWGQDLGKIKFRLGFLMLLNKPITDFTTTFG